SLNKNTILSTQACLSCSDNRCLLGNKFQNGTGQYGQSDETMMQRILHVIYVKRIAGAERHLIHLLRGLVDNPFELHILVLYSETNAYEEFKQHFVTYPIHVHGIN